VGGTDDKNNLAALTVEEHYLAHQLLVKLHPNNHKLIRAVHMMTVNSKYTRRSNKTFGWFRRLNALVMSEQMKEYQKEFGHPRGMAGKTLTKDHKKAISLASKGVPCPQRGVKGPRGPKKSPTKVVCRLSDRKELDIGNFVSYCKRLDNPIKAAEQDAKRSKATKGIAKPQVKVKCPHCPVIGGANIMKHHHYDNCKEKKEEYV
jgi:hypothetical protein